MIAAKAQPTNTFLPVVQKRRTSPCARAQPCAALSMTQQARRRARGVTYIDASGEEVFQPADLVILASWTLSNNRLLMLSGEANLQSSNGQGHAGKKSDASDQLYGRHAFFEKPLNRFMGAGGAGMRIADFDGDVFDHSNLPFLRGGNFGAIMTGTAPIATFGVLPQSIKARWGSEWKKAAMEYYDRTGLLAFSGEQFPTKAISSISTPRTKITAATRCCA